jgi:hypothetical protein
MIIMQKQKPCQPKVSFGWRNKSLTSPRQGRPWPSSVVKGKAPLSRGFLIVYYSLFFIRHHNYDEQNKHPDHT